jgi:secreted trypsin-like serine protease
MIEGINLSYHCGGSLVSKNKVVTAAHCVTNRQNDVIFNSSRIVIYLGKYHQLQYGDDLGVQTKQVIRINVYPSYNSSNYLGDIAVLTLSSDAEYTNYVTPVCLWDERSDDVNDIVGKDGTVVGWGFDENDTPTEELKMAKMPVVSHQTCLWSYPQFYSEFTSDKTFCAGFRNGTSVCNGDSGGGMVFNKNSKWYLRGIVSITVAKEGLRVCDTRHYVVFTDVAKYLDFVRKNLR